MIRKITVELAFPGDSAWTDISALVSDKSWTIDRQAFNDEKKSAVDKFSCSLKFDKTLLSKIRIAEERIVIRVKNQAGAPLFLGAIEPSVSHETSDHLGDIQIEASDNSWRLDEKVKTTRQMPESITDAGFYIWNQADKQHSICHIMLTEAGYADAEIDTSISDLRQIAMVSIEAGSSTYRELLDTLLMEHELVLHAMPDGTLTLLSWRPSTVAANIDRHSLSTVKPFRFDNRFDKRDGAKVIWAQPEIIQDVLVYRESLPVDENGIFTGEAIASGDYFPKDSDIEDIYQSYVDNWLDRPYLARETRLRNKDLTLIATSEQQLSYDADDGIIPDIAEFEYKRAHIRFVNNSSSTKKLYNFEIKANALIRKKVGATKASPLGTETDLLEYTSQYIYDASDAEALAEALAFDALAEEQYSFGLNIVIDIGSRVRIIELRNDTDVEAIIQKIKISGKSSVNEYEAVQFLYAGNLHLAQDFAIGNQLWPPNDYNHIGQEIIQIGNAIQQVRNGDLVDGAILRAKLEAGFVEEHNSLFDKIQQVRNGDLVDGAISRAKLEAGFVEEHNSILDEVYPFGLDHVPRLNLIESGQYELAGLVDWLNRERLDQDANIVLSEEKIKLAVQRITEAETNIASLEIDFDSISTTVASYSDHGTRISQVEQTVSEINSVLSELEVGGEIINLSLITQNADRIASIVANGGYTDENNIFHPTKAYTEVNQLADRYQILISGEPSADKTALAGWVATKDELQSFVTHTELNAELGEIEADISLIEQTAGQIQLLVADVQGYATEGDRLTKEELLAILDQSAIENASAIVMTEQKITLAVQKQDEKNIYFESSLTIQANEIAYQVARLDNGIATNASLITQTDSRITAEVSSRQSADSDIWAQINIQAGQISSIVGDISTINGTLTGQASQITQTANQITAEVSSRQSADSDIWAQINIQAGQISSIVGDISTINGTLTNVNSQISQLSTQISYRVQAKSYNPSTDTWSDTQAFMALRVALPETMSIERKNAIYSLLSSSEKAVFDRIYELYQVQWYGGSEYRYKITANPIPDDLDSMTATFTAKGLLSSQFLVSADELFLNGAIKAKHLDVDTITAFVINAVQANISDLTTKKLQVDSDPQSNLDFEIYINESTGILAKKNNAPIFSVNPSGNAFFSGDIEAGPLKFNRSPAGNSSFNITGNIKDFIFSVVDTTGINGGKVTCAGSYFGEDIGAVYIQRTAGQAVYNFRQYGDYYYKLYYTYWIWTATVTTYDIMLTLYKKSDGSVLFSYTDHFEPATAWIQGPAQVADGYPREGSPTPPSPNPKTQIGATSQFSSTGTLSFTAGTYTFQLNNLPVGDSPSYPAGTIYKDTNGFLKVK